MERSTTCFGTAVLSLGLAVAPLALLADDPGPGTRLILPFPGGDGDKTTAQSRPTAPATRPDEPGDYCDWAPLTG